MFGLYFLYLYNLIIRLYKRYVVGPVILGIYFDLCDHFSISQVDLCVSA